MHPCQRTGWRRRQTEWKMEWEWHLIEDEQEHFVEVSDNGSMPLSNGQAPRSQPRIHVSKSAAWPIPRSTPGQTSRLLLPSSPSSVELGAHWRPRKLSAYKLASSFQATNNTTMEPPLNITPSLSIELNEELLPTSYTAAGSSVGSIPSIFSPRPKRSLSIRTPTPKNNLSKTKSSFVERVVIHDQFTKWIGTLTPESAFLFFNAGKDFICMDMNAQLKVFASIKHHWLFIVILGSAGSDLI